MICSGLIQSDFSQFPLLSPSFTMFFIYNTLTLTVSISSNKWETGYWMSLETWTFEINSALKMWWRLIDQNLAILHAYLYAICNTHTIVWISVTNWIVNVLWNLIIRRSRWIILIWCVKYLPLVDIVRGSVLCSCWCGWIRNWHYCHGWHTMQLSMWWEWKQNQM